MSTRSRILIVDDEQSVLFVWRKALQKLAQRVDVEIASSGDEALHKMEQSPFDLLITDLRMPGLNGQALTRAIMDLQPGLLVIWITAYRSAEIEAEAEQLGVARCLDKPLTVDRIRQAVSQELELADHRVQAVAAGKYGLT